MPLSKLREFLDSHKIRYMILYHSVAYTAQGIAALTHISGKELAKTVIVRTDGDLAMAVVPASRHVDLALLKRAAGAKVVELASEQEFKDRFPDCEPGAMPPSEISTGWRCTRTRASRHYRRSLLMPALTVI